MKPSPAQRGRHSSPALIDDAMSEIFLRVPADDPKTLIRAAAVCTTWRRILSDLIFTRQYRAFHRAPPMLGFLRNTRHRRSLGKGINRHHEGYVVSNFVSTGSFRSPACHERSHWRVLDSRHGLVLFHTPKMDENFVVYDLVTCEKWRIYASSELSNIIWPDQDDEDGYEDEAHEEDEDEDEDEYDDEDEANEDEDEDENEGITWNEAVLCTKDRRDQDDEDEDEGEADIENEGITWNAAVLCAKDRCDHTYCHYGPYLVALVGSDEEQGITFASVYSSETRRWSDMISIEEQVDIAGHSAVVGDKVYFQCKNSNTTVEYNIGEQELSVFDPPVEYEDVDVPDVDLLGVDDGMLLFGTVLGPRLYLWSMQAGPNRVEEWARRRVIELGPMLPTHDLFKVSVVGFAEGVGVIFLRTAAGLYTIELRSGRSKNVHKQGLLGKVMPYMSFYTRALGQSPTSD